MNDEYYQQPQPEDDAALLFWMWCEEQSEENAKDICPNCDREGGEYTPTLGCCAFCEAVELDIENLPF